MVRALYLCLITPFLSGCIIYPNIDLIPRKKPFEEVTLQEARSFWTSAKIAVIGIHGLLAKHYPKPSLFASDLTPDPVSDLKEALNKAAQDDHVRAVLIKVDSPGGFVAWCDAMYRQILSFKKRTKKPLIVYIAGLGTSGGYYIALPADEIWAAPCSTVGSIGVLAVFLNLKGLGEKIGVEVQVVKSGPKKDMGSLWRGLAPEERRVMEGIINQYYARFLELVRKHRRKLKKDQLLELADGRILTAQQAQEAGLIDRVGYPEEALGRLKEMADLKDAEVVTYTRSYSYVNNIYSSSFYSLPDALNLKGLLGILSPGFYYLWYPGVTAASSH